MTGPLFEKREPTPRMQNFQPRHADTLDNIGQVDRHRRYVSRQGKTGISAAAQDEHREQRYQSANVLRMTTPVKGMGFLARCKFERRWNRRRDAPLASERRGNVHAWYIQSLLRAAESRFMVGTGLTSGGANYLRQGPRSRIAKYGGALGLQQVGRTRQTVG